MAGKLLISTAYIPTIEYFSLVSKADEIFLEKEENYLKQTYRNRCYILSPHGPQPLSVPVYLGSLHKTHIKDIRIDYSKRWQQVHLGAMKASYSASPFFEFYFESIEKIISEKQEFLFDLNMALTEHIIQILRINKAIKYTSEFAPIENKPHDFRYKISPKLKSSFILKPYLQVFATGKGFVPHLSIIDLIFNTGPEAGKWL